MAALTVDAWRAVPGLVHGFLPGDPPARGPDSSEWIRRVAGPSAPPPTLVVPRQVHGARIEVATGSPAPPPEADGLVTDTPGLAVGIATADCMPLLLLAAAHRVAAAVHAGWRGTLAGIVPAAVEAVAARARVAPTDISAAIGPAIGGCCYEVGPELWAAFGERYGERLAAGAFTPGPRGGRPHLDLRVLARAQLEAAGLPRAAIRLLGPCTACDSTYASYRRDGCEAGRQLSFIGWL